MRYFINNITIIDVASKLNKSLIIIIKHTLLIHITLIQLNIHFMIRASLQFHSPQTIYDFLEKEIGSLNILIKKGQAFINFNNTDHNELALRKFNNCIIERMPLKLHKHVEGGQMQPEAMNSAVPMSQDLRMINEAIQIKDPSDKAEVVVKSQRKDALQFISSHNAVLNALKNREKQIMEKGKEDPENVSKTIQSLYKNATINLNDVTKRIKYEYKSIRNNITNYGKSIDLDPTVVVQKINNEVVINSENITDHFHYRIKDPHFEVKRIAPLNDSQFICTTNHCFSTANFGKETVKNLGKLKIFNLTDQYEVSSHDVDDGAYAMLAIDKYILVGNRNCRINFFNISQGSVNEGELTEKLHQEQIYEMIRYGDHPMKILTLGCDRIVKLWRIQQEQITQELYTLSFHQQSQFSCRNQQNKPEFINTIDYYEKEKVIVNALNKLHIYDFTPQKLISETMLHSPISKLKKMTNNLIAAANTKFISFVDPRQITCKNAMSFLNPITSLCPISEYTLAYGSIVGQVGIIDNRKYNTILWKNSVTHNCRIYDITKMGKSIITGDQKGLIVNWAS